MVVDDVVEIMRDPEDHSIELSRRDLGLVFIKGTSVL